MTPTHRDPRRAARHGRSTRGLTLLEALLALAIAAILLGALAGLTGESLRALALVREHETLNEDARFAMERMVTAVSRTSRLLLPLAENPATAWSESVRDVLAVALDPGLDRNLDGIADADNDKDGLVDEDIGSDATDDGASGIVGIDDDNDGQTDESSKEDDDEDEDQTGNKDEEKLDGSDDDGDGAVDEDLGSDMNLDGAPGLLGIDDDGDGQTDESNKEDDDEDEDQTGNKDEDGVDPVVFFLSGTTLIERLPNLDPADGLDFTERPIAENVSLFRVERLAPGPSDRAVLVEITLQLASASGETVDLTTRVRAGGGP